MTEKQKRICIFPWEIELPPGKVFGELYFVGNQDTAAWLLRTDVGAILFDTTYPTTGMMLIHSLWSVGVAPRTIVAIFHTHGHYDHLGATAYLQAISGAKTYLGAADVAMLSARPELALIPEDEYPYLPILSADVAMQDGDVFSFGKTAIRAVSTPGHSPGAMSYFFTVREEDREITVGLHGGAGLNTQTQEFIHKYGVNWRQDFADSIHKLMKEKVDIFLGNHSKQCKTAEKLQRLATEPDAFIDPSEWTSFLMDLQEKFDKMILQERKMP